MCIVDFIFGLPGEMAEDRELTLAAIRRLTGIGATINSHFFIPLPGTPLANTVPGAPNEDTLLFLENLTSERLETAAGKGSSKPWPRWSRCLWFPADKQMTQR